MIKRLRIKFIFINMSLAVLVLITTFSIVCYLNYSSATDEIYTYMEQVLGRVASSTNTSIPQIEGVQRLESTISNSNTLLGERSSSDSTRSSALDVPSANGGDQEMPSIGSLSDTPEATPSDTDDSVTGEVAASDSSSTESQPQKQQSTQTTIAPPVIGSAISPGAPSLIAVFKVLYSGIYTSYPNHTTATVPENILLRADDIVINSPVNKGYLPDFNLLYDRIPTEGGYYVAYADASSTHEWENLAITLIGVGVIALAVFFLINIFFSRWALRPVATAMKQQQQFTADASHELKTPLTVILANMAILESQPDASISEQMQWVESTQTEAERMQLLVNDMLSLAKPKTGNQPEYAMERCDLSDVVEGEVLQFESVAFERGVVIESDIREGLFVIGNKEKLGRMTATLIDNACKYVGEDGVVDVKLSGKPAYSKKPSVVVLTVHNDGNPIPTEDLPHIFDRFYRADKARTSSKGGYGLGLAIGRDIAREHAGDITVTSSEEEGTTFTVTLPISE